MGRIRLGMSRLVFGKVWQLLEVAVEHLVRSDIDSLVYLSPVTGGWGHATMLHLLAVLTPPTSHRRRKRKCLNVQNN